MADYLKLLFDVKFSFSPNCHSGIASYVAEGHKCGCRRCREERGEPWDEQTEAQAARDSQFASEKFRKANLDFARHMIEKSKKKGS